MNHPAVRYIEALELALKYADTDMLAITDEEEERMQEVAYREANRMRGDG